MGMLAIFYTFTPSTNEKWQKVLSIKHNTNQKHAKIVLAVVELNNHRDKEIIWDMCFFLNFYNKQFISNASKVLVWVIYIFC